MEKSPKGTDLDALAAFAETLTTLRAPKPKLPAAEWNFSECPKSQLHYCQLYEYGRSAEAVIRRVEQWRESAFARADQPLCRNEELEELELMDLFRLFPEFPGTPWMALPKNTVKARLKSLPKRTPILVRTVGVDSLKTGDAYADSATALEPFLTTTIQPVEVNWFFSDKMLLSAFKDWLKENRPYPAQEMRGRTSPRELLNALAAWRLLKMHTYLEAGHITDEVLGKSLFRSQSDWLDARRKANDVLEGSLPQHPIEKLWKRLDKSAFSEEEKNKLWQYWITLKVSEARGLCRLSHEKFQAKMREILNRAR